MKPKINKYLEQISFFLKEKNNFFYVYRGQPSEAYQLNCTAFRMGGVENTKGSLRENQEKLLDDTKMKGLGYAKGGQRELYDLELLADLRHYGAPSCLMDFTSNFLIALWFACQEASNALNSNNGKIFIFNCFETDRFSRVSRKSLSRKIDHFLNEDSTNLWYWIPERFNDRLQDQDAVFVFGEPQIEEDNYKSIVVDSNDKKPILEELEKFFDYSGATLFSDKYAMGDNYKNMGIGTPKHSLEQAVYYTQIDEIDKAKHLLQKIIDDKKIEDVHLLLEANFQLGCLFLKERVRNKGPQESKQNEQKIKDIISTLSDDHPISELPHARCFSHCLSKSYKEGKIKQIKKQYVEALKSMLPNPKE